MAERGAPGPDQRVHARPEAALVEVRDPEGPRLARERLGLLREEDLHRVLLDALEAQGERRGVGVADAAEPGHPQHRIVQLGQRELRRDGDAQHLDEGVGQCRHHPGDLDRPGQGDVEGDVSSDGPGRLSLPRGAAQRVSEPPTPESLRAAWAAARRATGTRKGEQDT